MDSFDFLSGFGVDVGKACDIFMNRKRAMEEAMVKNVAKKDNLKCHSLRACWWISGKLELHRQIIRQLQAEPLPLASFIRSDAELEKDCS